MIRFYFNASPNPVKVALLLEELELPYEPIPIDTGRGAQFAPEYLAINPNAKVPAIVENGVTVFDSNAILLYLAERTGRFLPANPVDRGPLLSWLMFVASGVGPFSGQAVHFRHFAPETVPYASKRYEYEARRHYGVLDAHLAEHRTMVGDTYTIVDMGVWAWARMLTFLLGDGAWDPFPNLKRLHDEVSARPAAAKALALRERFTFNPPTDDEGRRHMFKHLDGAKG